MLLGGCQQRWLSRTCWHSSSMFFLSMLSLWESIDCKTSMITDEDPLWGLLFYSIRIRTNWAPNIPGPFFWPSTNGSFTFDHHWPNPKNQNMGHGADTAISCQCSDFEFGQIGTQILETLYSRPLFTINSRTFFVWHTHPKIRTWATEPTPQSSSRWAFEFGQKGA